jgi:LAS superfamily LD-carboxypeptidase LdcB
MASQDLFELLTGQTERHLVPCWSGHLVHAQVLPALEELRQAAMQAGFELAIASSYRSYQRQLSIWKAKAAGQRPLLADNGTPLDSADLSEEQILERILRWSALPGTSRHHWGTDLDVYDAAAMPADYQLQLTPEECEGLFKAFHGWLDDCINSGDSHGFFRPFDLDRGGVAPEPWHLSYRPLADSFARSFDFDAFQRLMAQGEWPLLERIKPRAQEIYQRYVAPEGATLC